MKNFYKDKCVFITGAAGTVGKELVRQLLIDRKASRVIAVDNNEAELFNLVQEFREHSNIEFYLADVRDESRLSQKMSGVDVVVHAAAYKHVIFCEQSPEEAIKTNIIGLQNIITSASKNKVRWLVFTSTDKAVNPTSVMGTSKLMGERIITAASQDHDKVSTTMFSVRFGNILGSSGSVIPIFHQQIKEGKPITLTDKNMTRFVMTVQQSALLILNSVPIAKGGEVIVTKMPVIRITDLATVMIRILAKKYGHSPSDIAIKLIGIQPGEKLFEELMSEQEVDRSIDVGDYFVTLPNFKQKSENKYAGQSENTITLPYNSANSAALSQEQLYDYLTTNKLLGNQYQAAERYFYVT